jgi:hypothetical protein
MWSFAKVSYDSTEGSDAESSDQGIVLVFHKSRKIQWSSKRSSSSHKGLSCMEPFFNMFSSRKLHFDAELRLGKQLLKMSQLSTKDSVSLLEKNLCPSNSLAMQFLLSSEGECPLKHLQEPETQTVWGVIQLLSTAHASPISASFAEKQAGTS